MAAHEGYLGCTERGSHLGPPWYWQGPQGIPGPAAASCQHIPSIHKPAWLHPWQGRAEAKPAPRDQGLSILVPSPMSPLSPPTCRRRRSFGNPPVTCWLHTGKRQPEGKGQSWWDTRPGATSTAPWGQAPAPHEGSPGWEQLGMRWTTCGRRPCHGERSVTAPMDATLPHPCAPRLQLGL